MKSTLDAEDDFVDLAEEKMMLALHHYLLAL